MVLAGVPASGLKWRPRGVNVVGKGNARRGRGRGEIACGGAAATPVAEKETSSGRHRSGSSSIYSSVTVVDRCTGAPRHVEGVGGCTGGGILVVVEIEKHG